MLHRVFDILQSTPAKLSAEVEALSAAELRTRPMPGKWSMVEVLAHLDDVEEWGMRSRIAAIVESDRPLLKSYDQDRRAAELRYADQDPFAVLENLRRQREANLAWLRTLDDAQLARTGVHEKVGELSARDFLHEWAFHDLGHLRQILEIKRYFLYPLIGNMKKFYRLQWGEPG